MIRPFLKWAGGKSRVLPELLPRLPTAKLLVEPFVGGASVFLSTDYQSYMLADSNYDLINLYKCVTRNTDLLLDAARALFKDGDNSQRYYSVREFFNQQAVSAELIKTGGHVAGCETQRILRAAQFLYLNRHCYNGVCRYNLKGEFNSPVGKHKKIYFPEVEIREFAEKANDTHAVFLCADFQMTLKATEETDAVIYCDPPYIPVSKTSNFTQYNGNAFTEQHHRQLVNSLIDINTRLGVPIIISNSNNYLTHNIYSPFKLYEISVQRSINTKKDERKKVGEVIGILRICKGCGLYGGGFCPDCGPVMGDATYNGMLESEVFDE